MRLVRPRIGDDFGEAGRGEDVAHRLFPDHRTVRHWRRWCAGHDCGGDAVVTIDAGDLLDQIGWALDVQPPRGRLDGERTVCELVLETQEIEDARDLGWLV